MELLCLYWQCQIWPWQELWFASKFCRCTSSLLPPSRNNLTWAYDWKPSTWSAVISINKLILNELLTWARDMITWYWKADFLFGQQSINQLETKIWPLTRKCAIRLSVRMSQKKLTCRLQSVCDRSDAVRTDWVIRSETNPAVLTAAAIRSKKKTFILSND